MSIKDYIKSFKDFPVEGINFKDTAGLCAEPKGFKLANYFFYSSALPSLDYHYGDKIKLVGIDARGFPFAAVLASKLEIPLILARKAGKLPGPCHSVSYDLEYGKAIMEIQSDTINKNDNVIIIDDLMATGGTMNATIDLVEKLGGHVISCLCLIDLSKLGGSSRMKKRKINFKSAVRY